ncbi:MAG: HAMP domain-containing sensor histidine kinase [Clostridiaceae bacterium]|nr:HAMP domain-containing sensor histidine kinase [Clostridiaceae bacterium]
MRKMFGFTKGIKRRWLVNNLSVIVIVVICTFSLGSISISNYYTGSVRSSLQSRASTTSKIIKQYMSESYDTFYYYAGSLTNDFSDKDKVEMQVIDRYGRIMFSSTGLSAGFVPSADDVSQAISTGTTAIFVGDDSLTGEHIMAVTAPIYVGTGDTFIGAVRYVTSLKLLDGQLTRLNVILVAAALAIVVLVMITNQFFIKSIVNPVLQINELARRIAKGQYGARLDVAFDDEIGELCTTINNMSAEIARMEKIKNDFISSVSHELRTPLTAIGGWAETIESDLSDAQTATAGLEIIKKETRRLSQMVEELLDFSRIESGALKLQTELFDLRGELYDAVFTYTDMLRQNGLEINYSESETPIMVVGDRNRLKQVFLNIIDNAGKYGKDGDRIDISIILKGVNAVVKIRDYGVGIPENELPFVKDKFFKGSARGRGAGIGLAVCNEIIILHDGTLDIASVYGEGTEITITIPAEVGESVNNI